MRRVVFLLCALLTSSSIGNAAERLFGLGFGVLRLPDNDGGEALLSPNGESDEGILVLFRASNPNGWGVHFRFDGYRYRRIGLTWTVPAWSLAVSRCVSLSDGVSNIGIFGGPSFLYPRLEADPDLWDVAETTETWPAPGLLMGVHLEISLHPRLVGFVNAAKIFARSDLPERLFEDPSLRSVRIGPAGTYGGLAYRF